MVPGAMSGAYHTSRQANAICALPKLSPALEAPSLSPAALYAKSACWTSDVTLTREDRLQVGWRLMGGGELDCLHEKLEKPRRAVITDQLSKEQSDEGGKEGTMTRPARCVPKHAAIHLWMLVLGTIFTSFFFLFLTCLGFMLCW